MNKDTNEVNIKNRISLQLYVTGMTPRSMEAIRNITHLCNTHFQGKFDLEIIDLYKTPEAAEANQIIFSPSLIKMSPLPRRVIIGTFSNTDQVVKSLNIGVE